MISVIDLRKKAKGMGIISAKLTKVELIQAIQQAEGNFPCFKTAQGYCDQQACAWRDECLAIA